MQDEKVYEGKGIRIKTILLTDGVHIKWENASQLNGILKIYRREEQFYPDKYDETQNGILVVDSEIIKGKKGETVDYISQGRDYFYTVNYKNHKGWFLRRLKLKFFFPYTNLEPEKIMQVLNITRFSIRLPIPKEGLLEDEYEKEKLATTIFKEKAEQAKYQANRAEAEETIAIIKKRTAFLFEKPKKGMTAGERLRDRERRRQEYLQVVEELKKDLPPEQQERLDAEAYQEIEKIK